MKKIKVTYTGNDKTKVIKLGFRPKVVRVRLVKPPSKI